MCSASCAEEHSTEGWPVHAASPKMVLVSDAGVTPTQTPRAPGRIGSDVAVVLLAGVLYIAGVAFRPWLLPHLFGVPAAIDARQLAENGLLDTVANTLLKLPSLVVIIAAAARGAVLRRALTEYRGGFIAITVITTHVLSLALNAFGLWIFTWRLPTTGGALYARALVASEQWASLVIWVLGIVVMVPLIEEVVFRYGVLRYALAVTGSRSLAVLTSSAAFALGHLILTPIRSTDIHTAAWLFAGSLVLGSIALRAHGGLSLCLAAHSTRNATEALTLFMAISLGAGDSGPQ